MSLKSTIIMTKFYKILKKAEKMTFMEIDRRNKSIFDALGPDNGKYSLQRRFVIYRI